MNIGVKIKGFEGVLDTDELWLEEFTKWDAIVPVEVAQDIANHLINTLESWTEDNYRGREDYQEAMMTKRRNLLVEARHVQWAIETAEARDWDGIGKYCPLMQAAKEAGIVSYNGTAGIGSSVLYPDWPKLRIPFHPPLPQELYSPGSYVNDEMTRGWAWRHALEYAALEPYRFELEVDE